MDDSEMNEAGPLTGLFDSLRAADRAARGLIALGLKEDQIEIVDLTRLIADHSPEFATQMEIGTSAAEQSNIGRELIETFGRSVVDEMNLPDYLVDLGVSEYAAPYYAGKIRDGFAAIIASPDEACASAAKRLVDEMKLQNPNSINKLVPK